MNERPWYRLHGWTWVFVVLSSASLVLMAFGPLSVNWWAFGWPLALDSRTGFQGKLALSIAITVSLIVASGVWLERLLRYLRLVGVDTKLRFRATCGFAVACCVCIWAGTTGAYAARVWRPYPGEELASFIARLLISHLAQFARPICWLALFLAMLSLFDLLGWAFNRLTRKREVGGE